MRAESQRKKMQTGHAMSKCEYDRAVRDSHTAGRLRDFSLPGLTWIHILHPIFQVQLYYSLHLIN